MLQDPSSVINHILDDPLSGENLMYLGGNTSREPRPGSKGLLWVLLKVVLDWDDTLLQEGFGLGLFVVLPIESQISALDGDVG